MKGGANTAMSAVRDRSGRRRAGQALSVAIQTAAYLIAVGGEIPVFDDTTREMLFARDGLAVGLFEGRSTTFGGFRHGELWLRFLAGTFAAGLGPLGLQVILTALVALSVAVFDRGVRKHFGEDIGWASVAVFVPLVIFATAFPLAAAGCLSLLALVGATLALLEVVTTGSMLAACIVGASLPFAAEAHPVALLGVPVVVLTVVMSCRRPVSGLILTIASGAATALALSPHGWAHNVEALLGAPSRLVLVTGALVVALLVAARARHWWRGLDVDRRRFLLIVGIVGMVTAEVIVASTVARTQLLGHHYLLFAVPSFAILAALGLRRLCASSHGGLGRALAIIILIVVLSVPLSISAAWRIGVATGVPSVPNYSFREVEILARHFWRRDYSFPDLQRHLRGPQSRELIGALAVFAPSADGPLERATADVRILAFAEPHRPEGVMPAGGEEVNLGCNRRVWILPLDGWVRLAPSRACFEPAPPAGGQQDCVDIYSSSIAYTGRYRDLDERVFPALREARFHVGEGLPGRGFTWELPVEITGDDPERHVDIVGLIGVVPWMIVRVEDVAYRGELPARHVVLERSAKRSGRLVLVAAESDMTLKEYPPDFLETRPAEAPLRDSIRRLPPLGGRICKSLGTCPDPGPG